MYRMEGKRNLAVGQRAQPTRFGTLFRSSVDAYGLYENDVGKPADYDTGAHILSFHFRGQEAHGCLECPCLGSLHLEKDERRKQIGDPFARFSVQHEIARDDCSRGATASVVNLAFDFVTAHLRIGPGQRVRTVAQCVRVSPCQQPAITTRQRDRFRDRVYRKPAIATGNHSQVGMIVCL